MTDVQRRQFLVRSVSLALLAGARVEAQPRTYRMAYLVGSSDATTAHLQKVLFGGLEELGYREGRNLTVERRFAEGRVERLPALAAELVALKPDVIFAGASQAALAASKATSTIPIVFVGVPDPVGTGIVRSLGRPASNATGLSAQSIEIHSKRLQLLKEVFPSSSRVAVLHNPLNTPSLPILATLKDASKALKFTIRVIETKSVQDFAPAFKLLATERPDVLYVIESPLTFVHRARIVDFANGMRLPAMYGFPEFAEAGGLMSYSFSLIEHYRAAAIYIDKILKGAKPSDLPVAQPTRFELVLNLKTAKALGVKFPPSILLRADRVIE
jgi:putative ABC transport system substrate-binding protein